MDYSADVLENLLGNESRAPAINIVALEENGREWIVDIETNTFPPEFHTYIIEAREI